MSSSSVPGGEDQSSFEGSFGRASGGCSFVG